MRERESKDLNNELRNACRNERALMVIKNGQVAETKRFAIYRDVGADKLSDEHLKRNFINI